MATNGITDLVPVGGAGVVTKQEFGSKEVEQRAETAMAAVAAREKAAIEARYLMAIHRPRDVENFRVRLLKECRRPGFAELAEYARPVGKEYNDDTGKWEEKIARGPSIRLIESAIQHFGNMAVESPVIFDNDELRIVRCQMTDLETNSTWMQDIVIPKRTEKRGYKKGSAVEAPRGRTVVGQRVNSSGDVTFLVLATDDETTIKQSSLVSKTQRKNGERLLPSDIIHEALRECHATLERQDAEDPDAAKRRVIDAFASQNIKPADLEMYVGKTLDRLQPADLKELRGLFTGIKEGDITWEEALSAKNPEVSGSKEAQQEVLKNKLAAIGKKKEEAAGAKNQHATDSKVDSGGGASTDSAQSSASSGSPAAEQIGNGTAPASPEQTEGNGNLAQQVMAYRDKVSLPTWKRILAKHSIEMDADVTQENFTAIVADLEDARRDEKQPETPRLRFGQKGGSSK